MKPWAPGHPKHLLRIVPALLLVGAPLAGCTTVHGDPIPDWPALTVIEHHVPHSEMRERCTRYTPAFMSPEACAEFYFSRNECHIWFSADFPPSETIVRHEREHCRGVEHAGESGMQAILERYLASRDVASASTGPSAAPSQTAFPVNNR